jgi:hypothetical protein
MNREEEYYEDSQNYEYTLKHSSRWPTGNVQY